VQPITAKAGGAEDQDAQSTVLLQSSCLDPLSSPFPFQKAFWTLYFARAFSLLSKYSIWLPVPRLLLVLTLASLLTLQSRGPIVHFRLHHTAHCTEKIVSVRLRASLRERKGRTGKGGRGQHVHVTWSLLITPRVHV